MLFIGSPFKKFLVAVRASGRSTVVLVAQKNHLRVAECASFQFAKVSAYGFDRSRPVLEDGKRTLIQPAAGGSGIEGALPQSLSVGRIGEDESKGAMAGMGPRRAASRRNSFVCP